MKLGYNTHNARVQTVFELSNVIMKFEEKFIAFVDILGWKDLVKASESGNGFSLAELKELTAILGSSNDVERFNRYGPRICPVSKYQQRNLSFELTQVSDCVIVSSEISPSGVINLISHCWGAVLGLMIKGIMCRGYITKGSIHHNRNEFIGSGYQNAYNREGGVTAFKLEADERGTPFVEIDPVVCSYVKDINDSCVKEMFSRLVKSDSKITALFPFQRLSHQFIIGGFGQTIDPQKEKISNQNMRKLLANTKTRVMSFVDQSNPKAVKIGRAHV